MWCCGLSPKRLARPISKVLFLLDRLALQPPLGCLFFRITSRTHGRIEERSCRGKADLEEARIHLKQQFDIRMHAVVVCDA